MKRVLGVFVAQQTQMGALLAQLAQQQVAAPAGGAGDETFERGCACGATARVTLPGPAAERINVAWERAHTRPGCRPVSRIAAFELRHERAGLAWQVQP